MSVRAKVDKANLAAQIQAMEQRFRDAIRPASYAGAQVYYREVKMHVPRDSGLLAGEKCTNRMTGFYNTEYKPDVCTIHDTAVADPAAADAAAAAVPQDQIQNG